MEGLELSSFIQSTLVQIAKGMKEANTELKKDQIITGDVFLLRRNMGDKANILGIQFDIALTANKTSTSSTGIKVMLAAAIGIGADGKKEIGDELAHRIKFEIALDHDLR